MKKMEVRDEQHGNELGLDFSICMLSKIFTMQINDSNYGWEDLIFIPPGRSSSEHLATVDA